VGNRKPCAFTETDIKRAVHVVTAAKKAGVDVQVEIDCCRFCSTPSRTRTETDTAAEDNRQIVIVDLEHKRMFITPLKAGEAGQNIASPLEEWRAKRRGES
jgi:hypothetical protein